MPTRLALALAASLLALTPVLADPGSADSTAPGASVSLEVRLITIGEDFFDSVGIDFFSDGKKLDKGNKSEEIRKLVKNGGNQPVFLDENQTRKLIHNIVGDVRNNITHTPRLIVADGKEGMVRSTEKQSFVTGVNVIRQDGQLAVCPKTEILTTGFVLAVRPTIRKDRRAIGVLLRTELASLESGPVPLFPVTVPVMPAREGEKSDKPQQPVVFTQNIQQPRLNTLSMQGELTIPDGRTALLGGWKRVREARNEFGPPVLSKVPGISKLVKQEGYTRFAENVLIMVTARIVPQEEKETAASRPTVEKKDKDLESILLKYEQACASGQLEEAKKLAREALDIDPACLSRP